MIYGHRPRFVVFDEIGDLDLEKIEAIFATYGRIDRAAIARMPAKEAIEPFEIGDIRRRDPKQPAWANRNQAPRSARRQR